MPRAVQRARLIAPTARPKILRSDCVPVAIESKLETPELRHFYKTLVQSVRQYNVRLGLFDYALDRQNKRLDPPFTVGELEKIEKTFRRVQDELHSAIRLLQLAEKNPELDLVQLLRNEYQEDIQRSSEYVSQTVDLGASGQFIHELLVLETNLRQDIAGLTGSYWRGEETEEEEEATREEKNESEKRPILDLAVRETLQMANDS